MSKQSPIKLFNGTSLKSIDFAAWGGIDNFLLATSTGAGGTGKPTLLKRVVPWLAKANNMTANAIADLPFDILKANGDEYDTSVDWHDNLGGMPNPKRLIRNLASSLCYGRAYMIPVVSDTAGKIVKLQYCAPHTVVPLITVNGLQWFSRTSDWGQAGVFWPAAMEDHEITNTGALPTGSPIGADEANRQADYARKNGFSGEMMYFWLPDSDIEIGPAKTYPMSTALISAEMLSGMDSTLTAYAESGFIPPTLLAAKGMPAAGEKEKTEAWWNRFLRRWGDTAAKVVNADAIDVKRVGAGMDELNGIYKDLTRQQIENIGAAHGIPGALFMSDMAFASEFNAMIKFWYNTSEFISIYHTIEETFNDQLLNRFDLHMVFKPETLDIYAEDESKRANAFRMYVSARIRPSIIGEMLQLDLPDGMEYSALDEMFDKPEVDKPVSPLINPGEAPAQVPVTTGFGKALQLDAGMIKDLALWKDIAVRCFRKNKGAAVDFECKALMEEYAAPIRKALAGARDEADIIKAFDISGPDTDSQQSEADNVVKAMYLEVMALKAQKVG